jgi:hypothetical protein
MLRQRLFLAISVVVLSGASAMAGDLWTNFWTDWHRNNAWMEPFIYPDRASVCNINQLQIAKGWQLQNTMGDPHFEADNGRLSPLGVAKLRSILTQNPAQYRNVFIQRGLSDDITTRRLATVQQAAAEIARGPFADVLVSDTPMPRTPAQSAVISNAWLTGYMQSVPHPQPEAFTGSTGGSSGGGGGGGM